MTTKRSRRFKAAFSSPDLAYEGLEDRPKEQLAKNRMPLGPTAGRGRRREARPRSRAWRSGSPPGRRLLLRLRRRRLWCAGHQRKAEHGNCEQLWSPPFDLAHENACSPPSEDDQAAPVASRLATLL
jgi:hypothetical protein